MRKTWLLLGLACTGACTSNGGSTCPGIVGTGSSALEDNPAGLDVVEHAPLGRSKANAVVVALHGCTQTAQAYEGAGWDALADELGFAVIYPQQTTANNAQRCFRWWDPAHVTRGQGEARSIESMVTAAKAKYGASRVYVTGLSAGAAMAVVMLAAYPDLFEAGAIMAGIPYGCAKSSNDSFTCMSGKEQSGEQWAALLPADARSKPPRVSIWTGDADYVVRPTNAEQLVRQWSSAHGASDAKAVTTEAVGIATHETFANGAVERWTIAKMGHGVAVSPADGCGTAGAFLVDAKLCSTQKAAEFFGLTGDGAAPSSPGAHPPRDAAPSSGGNGTGDGASQQEGCSN
jgi:poly(hydroxyalkanoate) depolymerase family esterase